MALINLIPSVNLNTVMSWSWNILKFASIIIPVTIIFYVSVYLLGKRQLNNSIEDQYDYYYSIINYYRNGE